MKVQAYAAMSAKSALKPFKYEFEQPLKPDEVEVQISHCGICHSDIHLIDNDWKYSSYPLVPGHEIIGHVKAKGDQVSHLEIGDRVGIGWQCSSCGNCEWCFSGQENFCSENQATCASGHFGGFADLVRAQGRFTFKIPETLSSEEAAPLLCGGITVYTPFKFYGVTSDMTVGVIGIGGLGHMALQFAKAMGCEVAAFSTSESKAEEAIKLGAHRFVHSANPKALNKERGRFDFLLSTATADLNWTEYMNLLKPGGKLCVVGASPGMISVPVFSLLGGNRSVCGSVIGNTPRIREMLEFSARHQIGAQTEIMQMSECNQALDKVRANEARFRMVLRAQG